MASPVPRRRGRPPCCPLELAIRVIRLSQHLSCAQIAAVLNVDRIPTPTGRPQWRREYVDRLLHTQYVRDIIESEAEFQLLDATRSCRQISRSSGPGDSGSRWPSTTEA
jgi:hypothetical protein